ncbi:hypothetical protein KI387_019755, partial [Taxus chinensis]
CREPRFFPSALPRAYVFAVLPTTGEKTHDFPSFTTLSQSTVPSNRRLCCSFPST